MHLKQCRGTRGSQCSSEWQCWHSVPRVQTKQTQRENTTQGQVTQQHSRVNRGEEYASDEMKVEAEYSIAVLAWTGASVQAEERVQLEGGVGG